MRFGCIPPAAVCLTMFACGGGDDAPANDPDASPSCGSTWQLRDAPADSLALLGSEAVAGRTVRVAVTIELVAECEELAMMSVGYTLENEGVVITPRVWGRSDCNSDGFDLVTRPVVLELYAGDWTIAAAGVDNLEVTVAPQPGACNLVRDPCQLDCDCDVDAGERCLSYDGFAGPSTMCARPCEVDRDCNGTTCDGQVTDGLGFACTTTPECDGTRPCPVGWTCAAGACAPEFTLGQGTRRECACDDDCEPGMRCTEPYDPQAPRRCEAQCATAGPWCQGAHACGSVGSDLSGLAVTDAVCGWLGE